MSPPFQTGLDVVLTNNATHPVKLHPFLTGIPSLVLEVKDSKGEAVGLPPPPIPPQAAEMDAWPMRVLTPGEQISLRFENFLDWDAKGGGYVARYRSTHPYTGGSPEHPLTSKWTRFRVTSPRPRKALPADVPPVLTGGEPWTKDGEVMQRVSGIPQSPTGSCPDPWGKEFVRAYFSRAEDEPAVGSAWKARFRVDIDRERPVARVTVRVRVGEQASSLDLTSAWKGWSDEVSRKWSNRFKICWGDGRNKEEMPIEVHLVQVVTDSPAKTDWNRHEVKVPGALSGPRARPISELMKWYASDNLGVAHEVGHLLGNRDEYGKYADGVDYGCWYKKDGNIMNNPRGCPEAKHYDLVCWAVGELLGTPCTVRLFDRTR